MKNGTSTIHADEYGADVHEHFLVDENFINETDC